MSGPEPYILLTGGNGYIGFNILHHLLKHGHHVRAVTRSEEKAATLQSHSALKQWADHLTTITIPDFTAQGAWTAALANVTHIVHLASPANSTKPGDDLTASFITPAVANVLAVLQAAHTHPASLVRRIVVTSSIVGIAPPSHYLGPIPDFSPTQTVTHTATARVLPTPPLAPSAGGLDAYNTGKIAALNAAEDWVRQTRPRFDVVHVMPALVGGGDARAAVRADLMTSSTVMVLIPSLSSSAEDLAKKFPFPVAPAALVHVRDVCEVHARALLDEERVPHRPGSGHCESFLVNTRATPIDWAAVQTIVQRHFADAVSEGVVPNKGVLKGNLQTIWDASETEARLGLEFKTLEDITVDTVQQWLSLPAGGA